MFTYLMILKWNVTVRYALFIYDKISTPIVIEIHAKIAHATRGPLSALTPNILTSYISFSPNNLQALFYMFGPTQFFCFVLVSKKYWRKSIIDKKSCTVSLF